MRKEEIRRFLQSLVLSSSWTRCHSYFLPCVWEQHDSQSQVGHFGFLFWTQLDDRRWVLHLSTWLARRKRITVERICVHRLCLASVFSCMTHVTSLQWRPLMVLNLSVLESELEFPATSHNLPLLPCSSSFYPPSSTLSTTDLITTDFPVKKFQSES